MDPMGSVHAMTMQPRDPDRSDGRLLSISSSPGRSFARHVGFHRQPGWLAACPTPMDRDENGTDTRNGYQIRVLKQDIISDTDTDILFVGTDTSII
jgi:hypothetical protein